uniref:Uncharacterized protein n=1 Tax=Lepeophtheirus salmonis TaxID=72036 RepID=A0A0K2VJ63_LEPSM
MKLLSRTLYVKGHIRVKLSIPNQMMVLNYS